MIRLIRRRGRNRLLAASGAVLLVVVGAVITGIATSSPAIHTRAQFVAGTPEGDIAGRPTGTTQVRLDTTLYLPGRTPAPAVLLAHGLGGSKSDLTGEARALARHGYVVLAYTARGFGRSGGLIHLDAPTYEVADALKLVSYLATLPEVSKDGPGDPRVGVAGSSYGGGLALLLAAADKRVDAVGADITWNDLTQSLFPNATDQQPGVFKKLWASELFASGGDVGSKDVACGRFAPELCSAYQNAARTGSPDAVIVRLLKASSPAGVLSRISAPTLLTQGEQDSLFPLTEADANARGIAANGTPVRVLWRAGGHDGATNTGELTTDLTGWFDPVLRRQGSVSSSFDLAVSGGAISSATGRRVSQKLRVSSGYPGAGGRATSTRAVSVSGPPQTIAGPAGGSPAAITTVPGVGSLLGDAAPLGGIGRLTSIPGQVAGFDAPATSQSLLVAGASAVSLDITAHDATDATLFVALRDVAADGTDMLPASLVAPLRLTGMTPGVSQTVTVRLPSIVDQLARGHHLRLTVSTTDLAYSLPTSPRTYTVSLAGASAAITVPTVDGQVVRSGQPGAWLITGLIAIGLAVGLGVARSVRRRLRVAVDASLVDVPVGIEGLVKEYGDGYRAVDGVTFRVERGQVVGLLGPNGAGKTTALRVLMGLIRPTAGQLRVFGELIEPGAPVLSRIGAFIEGPGFLPHLSGRDNLRLYWAATGRPDEDADLDTALEIAGLGSSIERRVKAYSHGMRQRLAIAQAMLGLPELLVLDEPTNGLDPPQIAEMREVLKRYAETGRTVVVSSHLLAEIEQTCTHVVVMHKGRLIAWGSVAEIAGAGGVQLAVDDPVHAADVLAAAGISSHTVPARRALEDVFLGMVGETSE